MTSYQNQNTNILSPKINKTYNLAIQFSTYQQAPKKNILSCATNTYRLPRIADVEDQENTNRKKSPLKNIFQSQKAEIMKVNQLMNQKSFNIVGVKEVKAYQNKIIKKKNVMQRRNQSALSLSRYSSSGKSQNQTGIYMNKEDVLGMIKIGIQQPSKLKNQNNTIQQNNQLNSSLRKAKMKMDHYAKIWDNKKIKKKKYPSILDQISEYRRKVQTQQQNQLKQKKNHMKQNVWISTLRSPKDVSNYYKNSFIVKVQKNGFVLKGKQKLKQELEWIETKDKSGYNFAFFQSYVKSTKQKQEKQQKKIGSGDSVIKSKPYKFGN